MTQTPSMKILVVEDNASQLKTLCDILENEGFVPVKCATGADALDPSRHRDTQVAILDLRLPDMNGLEVLAELRKLHPGISVIINTAYASLESAMSAVNQEAFAYVQKMGNVDELLRHVHRAFHLHFAGYSSLLEEEVRNRTAALEASLLRLKEKEKQLRQAQKLEAIGTLTGGIAHDFNNILFPIFGYTEMLRDDLPQGSHLREYADAIMKSAKRAADLVKQILACSRQTETKPWPVEPAHILKEIVHLVRSTLPSTIRVEDSIDAKTGMILIDPTCFYQIAMNLLTNAFHAMEDTGGTLHIGLRNADISRESPIPELPDGTYVCLTVRDTGTGMDEHTLEKIFDPYFTTKPQGKGTGLGLSVVHGIIRNCGGKITVKSSPGEGSVFDVYLPVFHAAALSNFSQEHQGDTESMPKGRERVLIADDETQILRLEKQILERLGYTAECAENGTDALKIFKANPQGFDILITDMTMPDMTGDVLARQIMEIRPGFPVIICTGFSEKILPEKIHSLGIKGLLMKPVSKSDLAHQIRKALAG